MWSVLTAWPVRKRAIVERQHMDSHSTKCALRRVRRQEQGQDLLEYALLVSLIAIVAMGAVNTVGNTITTVFWNVIASATAAI